MYQAEKLARSRSLYFLFVVVTITLGLTTRSHFISMPSFISTYGGDIFWAMMVFWISCLVFNQQATWRVASYAIIFSFMIEFSQFYHEPWIDELRQMKLGGLILGFAFKFTDLICYATGVSIGAFIDRLIINHV